MENKEVEAEIINADQLEDYSWMVDVANQAIETYGEHDRHVALISFTTDEAFERGVPENTTSPMVCNMSRGEFECGIAGAIVSYAKQYGINIKELADGITHITSMYDLTHGGLDVAN